MFRRITGLSYAGDVRMGLAEDSKKVERIVAGSYAQFRELYLPRLQVRERLEGGAGDARRMQVSCACFNNARCRC